MNNNDINKLSQNLPLVVLLASSLLLLFFKVYFAFEHGRYLAFGLDSARVLRVTQELSSMGSVDWFASGRVGLPIFAWLVSSAAGLTASNYFVIPFWLTNLGPALFIASVVFTYTKKITWTVVSVSIFSLVHFTATATDSFFMANVLVPIRISMFLLFISNVKKSYFRVLLALGVIFSTILGSFSYPIYSLLTDFYILSYLLFSHEKVGRFKIRFLVITQSIARLLFLFFFSSTYGGGMPILDLLYRVYSWWAVGTAKTILFLVFTTAILVELMVILRPKTLSTLKSIFEINNNYKRLLTYFTAPAVFGYYTLSILNIIDANFRGTQDFFTQNPTTFSPDLYYRLLTYFSTFFILITQKTKYFFVNHTRVVIVLFYILITVSSITGQFAFLSNSRFFVYILPYMVISLVFSFMEILHKKHLGIIFLVSLILLNVSSWILVKQSYREHSNAKIINAIDWLRKQPDSANTLFFAHYIGKEHLSANEKYNSLTYISSIVPWFDQRKLGVCKDQVEICVGYYEQYVKQHGVKYIVIEDRAYEDWHSKLSLLGETVYDDSVRIVKIW